MGKVDYIRSVFAKYGANKPIYHSEGSLLCHEASPICQPAPTSAFFDAQAEYLVLLYVRNWAAGLAGTSWYQFNGPGWRYSGLLDGNQNPKPVYYALQFLSNELGGLNFTQQIYQYSALTTYEFKNSSKRVWVMWAPDDAPHTISLPSGTTRVLDKLGNVIKTSNNQITVKRPIYIELTP